MKRNNLKNINVIEIGSGLGSFACSFLEYFKYEEKNSYFDINYSLLEISPTLSN